MFQISCDAMKEQRVPAAEDRVRLMRQVPHEQRVLAPEDRVRLVRQGPHEQRVPATVLSTMKMGTLTRRAFQNFDIYQIHSVI